MPTYSEMIKERYSASEQETDALGRIIKVQRLRPWDEAVTRRLADTDKLSVMSTIFVAACVREIKGDDGKPRIFTPPKSEADLAIVMNALDEEGLEAAMKAYARLRGLNVNGEEVTQEGVIDAAKNSQATAS